MRSWTTVLLVFLAVAVLWLVQHTYEEGFQGHGSLIEMDHHRSRTVDVDPIRNEVPLTIYQSWHSHKLPPKMYECVQKLLRDNPEFEYYLYDDEESEAFIKKYFNEEVAWAFTTLQPGAFKSDLWRYCVLYINGGVYLDIKYVTKRPLISVIDKHSTVFVKDEYPHNMCGTNAEEGVYNGFMISPPKNEVFKFCIDDIVRSCRNRDYKRHILDITGPCLLGSVLKAIKPKGYVRRLPFQYSNNLSVGEPQIKMNGLLILTHYPEYRSEQRAYQKKQHYSEMYINRQVYS